MNNGLLWQVLFKHLRTFHLSEPTSRPSFNAADEADLPQLHLQTKIVYYRLIPVTAQTSGYRLDDRCTYRNIYSVVDALGSKRWPWWGSGNIWLSKPMLGGGERGYTNHRYQWWGEIDCKALGSCSEVPLHGNMLVISPLEHGCVDERMSLL